MGQKAAAPPSTPSRLDFLALLDRPLFAPRRFLCRSRAAKNTAEEVAQRDGTAARGAKALGAAAAAAAKEQAPIVG